jgi:F0F1-type ATP synthase assembly protein I
MRWKISHHGHDPRQIDLLATLALLVVIAIVVAAWHYFSANSGTQNATAFIVPSQSVRW